ncbi:MAG: fatty oxidation complex subunit alpha [Bacteriovoracaceae bacterium]|jgi:3-hydroxyacyl-CoA dehydrogenase / enoyl-CoA hydratase / 3-hydroxybutyryl-CoA epimerase|nr:fatty oxidation complex subunit alpha [Bacteriovoracaceae bacterium]
MSFQKLSYEVKDNIAHIGFGYNSESSMTVLDEDTLLELNEALEEVKKGEGAGIKGLIFFSHIPRVFLAGADIKMIQKLNTEVEATSGAEKGQELYNKIDDLSIPTVACVDGFCLGGGLELALSCDHIIASDDSGTKFAVPEVKLGLLPGFGGTYRLPKKISLPGALDMILTGRMIDAKKAKKLGLVTEIFPKENLVKVASRYFKKGAGTKKRSSPMDALKENLEHMASENFLSRKLIFQKAREGVLKKTKGFYHAPLKILDVMEQGASKGRSSYLALEAQGFGELCVTEQSKNLIHIFFMHENSKKYDGAKGEGSVLKVKRGAVVGAGTMGGGIAWLFANNGQSPILKDLNNDALELGLKQSSANFSGALKRRKMSKAEYERKQLSISPQLGFDGFNSVDLVIEAVVEDMKIKKLVFGELENHVRDDCLLTSNTSSLSVTEMAKGLKKPERFAGLHFFNPVNRMPLVEIITHDKVAPETVEALYKWCVKVGKTPIVVGDGPGFLVNRILMPFLNEAAYLLEEGVHPEELDQACLNFGMPMGACRLMDEIGIDVLVKVGKIMEEGLGPRARACGISKAAFDSGLLGKKTSKGFYLYDAKGKPGDLNSEIEKFLPNMGSKNMDETSIQMRVFLPMINEAARILSDGIVSKASVVDLGLIFGTGFPPFRGGLLKYADSEGLDRITGALERFASEVNEDRYSPAPLLKNLVAEKKKFYDI